MAINRIGFKIICRMNHVIEDNIYWFLEYDRIPIFPLISLYSQKSLNFIPAQ